MRRRVAASVLLVLAFVLLSANPASGQTQVSASADRGSGSPGESILVAGTGWPESARVQVSLCGNNALGGSNDCDAPGSRTFSTKEDGSFQVDLDVAVPPAACPCVIYVLSETTTDNVRVPFEVIGAPESPPTGAPDIEPARAFDVIGAQLEGFGPWQSWFGGRATRDLVLTVENVGTEANQPVISATWGTGNDPTHIIDVPVLEAVPPGERATYRIPVQFDAFTIGQVNVVGSFDGVTGGQDFAASTSVYPWGLIALALVGFQSGLLLIRNGVRSHIAGQVDAEEPELDEDQVGALAGSAAIGEISTQEVAPLVGAGAAAGSADVDTSGPSMAPAAVAAGAVAGLAVATGGASNGEHDVDAGGGDVAADGASGHEADVDTSGPSMAPAAVAVGTVAGLSGSAAGAGTTDGARNSEPDVDAGPDRRAVTSDVARKGSVRARLGRWLSGLDAEASGAPSMAPAAVAAAAAASTSEEADDAGAGTTDGAGRHEPAADAGAPSMAVAAGGAAGLAEAAAADPQEGGDAAEEDTEGVIDLTKETSTQTEALMEDLVRLHADAIEWLGEARTKADALLAEAQARAAEIEERARESKVKADEAELRGPAHTQSVETR